jgi:hypothetical protein
MFSVFYVAFSAVCTDYMAGRPCKEKIPTYFFNSDLEQEDESDQQTVDFITVIWVGGGGGVLFLAV